MNESLSADYLMSFVSLPNVLGATGALFYVISMSMKTVIPLRITSIVSAACLLGSSVLARSLPAILLYALLLPVHSFRLYQMLELIKKVRAAARTDLSMNWLRPYMKKRRYRKGDVLFRKGDPADEMFLIGKGRYRVLELGNELQPGEIFGELALLTPSYNRTQSVECIESGHVLTLPYDEVRALYFENSDFISFSSRAAGCWKPQLAQRKCWTRNALRGLWGRQLDGCSRTSPRRPRWSRDWNWVAVTLAGSSSTVFRD